LRSSSTIGRKRGASIAPTDAVAGARRRGLVLPGLAVLAAFVVLVGLGNWQLRRLAWKDDLIARVAERPLEALRDIPPVSSWPDFDIAEGEYRPYRLAGHFLHDKEALVFTSLPNPNGRFGGPGYWVVTPFEVAAGGVVLVNRGFAPQGRHLPAERGETLPLGATMVTGLMRPDEPARMFLPDDRPMDNLFYARNVQNIAAAKGISGPLAPFTIDLAAVETPPGGLPQAGETRMAFTNNHLQYAITWYGLAAALLAVFATFVRQRLRGGA
jgi:surfeit locus 1 family protein